MGEICQLDRMAHDGAELQPGESDEPFAAPLVMGPPLDAACFADHSTEGPASGQLLRVNAGSQLEHNFDGPNRKQGDATSRGGRFPGVGRRAVMREVNRLLWL
jgi:hypothetical protein